MQNRRPAEGRRRETGPWGVSYAANITPDDKTGMGRWTLKSKFMYLKSIPAIENAVPPAVISPLRGAG